AEQYVQMWEERQHAGSLTLPETVQGLIAARLDGLSSEEKSVLQNAAVLGKVFWQGAIVAVDGIDGTTADEYLHALHRKPSAQASALPRSMRFRLPRRTTSDRFSSSPTTILSVSR